MPADPNEPTRVVREPDDPAARDPREPVLRERTVAPAGVDPAWTARLEDSLRSLRAMVALLAVVSLAALGVAIYVLVQEEDEGGAANQAASRGRVAALTDRVERLENRPRSASPSGSQAGAGDLAALQGEVDALEQQIEAGDGGGAEAAPDPDAASAADLTALDTRLDELAAQVEQLSSAGAGGTSTTP